MHRHLPRFTNSMLLTLVLIITATLLVGMVYTFHPASARGFAMPTPTPQGTKTPGYDPESGPIRSTPDPLDELEVADITGMIAQGILVVVIILFGAFWGWRQSVPRTPRKSKR